jgi:hypothetical protein
MKSQYHQSTPRRNSYHRGHNRKVRRLPSGHPVLILILAVEIVPKRKGGAR